MTKEHASTRISSSPHSRFSIHVMYAFFYVVSSCKVSLSSRSPTYGTGTGGHLDRINQRLLRPTGARFVVTFHQISNGDCDIMSCSVAACYNNCPLSNNKSTYCFLYTTSLIVHSWKTNMCQSNDLEKLTRLTEKPQLV